MPTCDALDRRAPPPNRPLGLPEAPGACPSAAVGGRVRRPARVIARAVQKSQHRDEKRHCLWQGSRKMGYDEDRGSWGMWGGVKAAGGGQEKE